MLHKIKVPKHSSFPLKDRYLKPTNEKTCNQKTKTIRYFHFFFSSIMHINYFAPFNTTQCQSSSNKLKFTMRFSFFETISLSRSMCFSIDLGSFMHPNLRSFMHPNLRSFSQFFITKPNLSKILIPN